MEGGSYKESASKKANDESDPVNRKSRRKICSRCHRPTPQACVCDALPDKRIKLKKASIVVLQHPHELKMKNRSIPILELCLEKESLLLCVGRRLGEEQVNEDIFKLLKPPNLPILLFPGEKNESDVLNMTDAKKNIPEKLKDGGKIVFIVLDATWKYAKEMHRANVQNKLYPSRFLRVSLQSEDFPDNWTGGRFDIRTTPKSEDSGKRLMSTAESIAFAVSELGGEANQSELYSTLMKPLDLMVQKWNSFVKQPKIRERQPPKKKHKKKR